MRIANAHTCTHAAVPGAGVAVEEGYRERQAWLQAPEEQRQVFPTGQTYSCPKAQELAMRHWLQQRDGISAEYDIRFYPARFDVVRGSILPLGDTTKWTGPPGKRRGQRQLCVLEEPEHLNWYHGGRNWRRRFQLVLGCSKPHGRERAGHRCQRDTVGNVIPAIRQRVKLRPRTFLVPCT